MKKLFAVIGFCVLFVGSQAFATTINFGDSAYYWPGWNNGTGDDSEDTIGIPNILGGSVTIENGKLVSVTFNYNDNNNGTSLFYLLRPGDLFIDLGANATWDRVVTPDGNVYDVDISLGNSGAYIFSYLPGYGIREDHPVWASGLSGPSGSASFSGIETPSAPFQVVSSTFAFNTPFIDIDSPFIIGWGPNCANDVVYERVVPTPEPSTLLLLGSGIIGLGISARKKFRKS